MTQNSKFLFVFLVLSLFISCAQAPQQLVSEKPAAPVVDLTSEKIRDSIVLIESENTSGTGFFVAPDKIVTNIHSVAHAGPISIKSSNEEKNWTIEGVVGFDTENGLVILKLTDEGTPLPLADSDRVQTGESVSILSYPDSTFKVLESRIQSLRKNNRWLRLNTTISKKTNGSPVFNNNGQVIGGIVPYGDYAVSSSVLEALLAESMPMEPLTAWQQRKHIRAVAYYSLGEEKFDTKDYAGALVDFDKAIEFNPAYVRAYYVRGRTQDRLGDYDSAIASCTQMLEMDPDEADAYYARGSIKAHLGDYTEAIIDLDKAIELDAQYAHAYSNRGGIKFLLGESEEANGNAEKAQSLYEAVIADCDKSIQIDPEYANTYNFRAAAKLTLGDLEGAIFDLNRTIEIDPEDADVYNNRGLVKFKHGESEAAHGNTKEAQRLYEAAIEDITKSIQIDPEDADVYNNRGLVKFSLGESKSGNGNAKKTQSLYEAAIDDYTQAIKINPKYAKAYNNRATVKCKLGDIESARGDAEKAQTLYREGVIDYGRYIQIIGLDDTDAKITDLESQHARNSTVRVVGWSGNLTSGSGFFVDKNKIVTNFHVIAELGPVFAMITDKEEVWAVEGVTAYDAKNDLVILKIAGEGAPLPLDNSDAVKMGDAVTVVGYPGGKYKTVSKGMMHSIRNSDKWFKVKVEIAPGNSGSPVINSSGQVIAIVSSMEDPSKVTELYGYAIPSNVLRTLLTRSVPSEPLAHWYKRDRIRAYAKYTLDQHKEAMADFDSIIQLNPEDADAYIDRAWVKIKLGESEKTHGRAEKAQHLYKAAIEDYTQAIRINPKFADAYNNRGVVRLELDDFEGALPDFNRAIGINPGHADAYKKRAYTKFKLGESKAAQGDITGTLQLYQSAMEDCTQVIWLTPKDADVYDNRGWARFHLGESETARGNMKKAADLYEEAIQDYTQAIKLNPEHPHAYRNRAKAKFRLGNYGAAIIDLDKAIQINPKNARYYYDRGRAKEALGHKEAAKADFQKAKELDPNVGQ
ncbi:MAG: tetratricopeptide repeat protein [Candidatus Poribacteria bacterium]|nr:tetratricopeptide repeat protein [Candidatus Poribacteria bacterium]